MQLAVGLAQSPLEDVPLDGLLWESPEASFAVGQLLVLWEVGVQNSPFLSTTP